MSDPVKEFDSLLAASDVLFVVYFQGHWCLFCISYFKQPQALTGSITASRGTPLVVTAEPASELLVTRSASGYSGKTIVDPVNVLIRHLQARGVLDVAVSDKKRLWAWNGAAGVLALKQDGTVLFRWATDEPQVHDI